MKERLPLKCTMRPREDGSRCQQVESEGKRYVMIMQVLWEEEEGRDQQPMQRLVWIREGEALMLRGLREEPEDEQLRTRV